MIVDDADEKQKCPDCGQNAEVVDDQDLVDVFFELADQFGARLQIISPDSEEGDILIKAFGGIAALLRYRLS